MHSVRELVRRFLGILEYHRLSRPPRNQTFSSKSHSEEFLASSRNSSTKTTIGRSFWARGFMVLQFFMLWSGLLSTGLKGTWWKLRFWASLFIFTNWRQIQNGKFKHKQSVKLNQLRKNSPYRYPFRRSKQVSSNINSQCNSINWGITVLIFILSGDPNR